MSVMSEDRIPDGVPERLIQAAIKLLAEDGPSAIKARTVASAAGLSSMVVYSHFGGIPELVRAIADQGFSELDQAFAAVPVTDDAITDLFAMALMCRTVARANPHLYDLMFGLSFRASYRPTTEAESLPSGRSTAFRAAYDHLYSASARLVDSGRVRPADARVVAAALWSYVHGFVTLELAEHFAEFKDPVREVMAPMGITLTVGLGADADEALASHEAAITWHRSAAKRT
jgi:AcrR family transcriptional regulator